MLVKLGANVYTKEKLELETAFPQISRGEVPEECAPETQSISLSLITCPNWHKDASKQHMDVFWTNPFPVIEIIVPPSTGPLEGAIVSTDASDSTTKLSTSGEKSTALLAAENWTGPTP